MKYLYRFLLLGTIFQDPGLKQIFSLRMKKRRMNYYHTIAMYNYMDYYESTGQKLHIFFHNVEFCSNKSGPMARTLSVPHAIVDKVLIIHVSSLIALKHYELLNALRFEGYWISLRSHFKFYISLRNLF